MSKLAIPQRPGDVLPADWWRTHALRTFDEMDDVYDVASDVRRLDALARYVKDRDQRGTLNRARVVGEMRMGELLGPSVGRGKSDSTHGIMPQDANRFRQLSGHRKLVLRLLSDGIDSRRRVLAAIDRLKQRKPREAEGIELRHGDFREVLNDLSEQVDAIITDPPYPQEFLPLWSDLSRVGADILRPGGVLAAMAPQMHLPDVLNRLQEALSYRWTMAYIQGGAAAQVFPRRVQTYWKPIVVFEKPPSDPNHRIGGDVVRSEGGERDNSHHHWGQTEAGMAQIIRRLTAEGDLVVDPFAGGGTTLTACAGLNRDCIGAEVDADAFTRAQRRLG